MSISITAKPAHEKTPYDQNTDTYIMLEIRGEEMGKTRAPLDIVAVIDCSSSMGSANKMEYVKKSLSFMIEHLGEEDYVTLIGYESTAKIALRRTRVDAEGKWKALKAVSELEPYGATNYSGALELSRHEAAAIRDRTTRVRRMVMFSDGCPTAGEMDPRKITLICGRMIPGWQLTTMAYGVASDLKKPDGMSGAVDLDLLRDMAKAGQGNFYYMKGADSAGQAFANELGGLLTTVAQALKIKVRPVSDRIDLKGIMEDLDVEDKGDHIEIAIPDVLAGETRYATLSVTCNRRPIPDDDGAEVVADIDIEYLMPSTGEYEALKLRPMIQWTAPGAEDKAINVEVNTQLAVVKAAPALEKALESAQAGDYDSAKEFVREAALELKETGTERGLEISESLDSLSEMVSDEISYVHHIDEFKVSGFELQSGRSSGGGFSEGFTTRIQSSLMERLIDELDETITDSDESEEPSADE
jgi:Ca-activated chloride channel family protein